MPRTQSCVSFLTFLTGPLEQWLISGSSHLGGNAEWASCWGKHERKIAPQPEPTIPHLKLCGAVLATELAELILEELDHKPDAVKFFCDSKVVLGYIHNDTKRFFVYVHNRVHRIWQSTSPQQWRYVPTDQNPADLQAVFHQAVFAASHFPFNPSSFIVQVRSVRHLQRMAPV